MKRTITALCLLFIASPAFSEQTNSTYNFIITVDGAKQDMLLVGPENEDIHIGVIGRKLYPTDETRRNRNKWPEGKWIASVSTLDDPASFWWDYELTLKPDYSVEFTEIERHQAYDHDFRPKGKKTTRTRLAMKGHWKMVDGKGQIVFTKPKTEPNSTSDGIRQPADGSSKPSM